MCRGQLSEDSRVHDEEAGVSLRLGTLLSQPSNRAKLAAARIALGWENGTLVPEASSGSNPARSRQDIEQVCTS